MATRSTALDDTLIGVNYNPGIPAAQGPGPEREWNIILDEMKQYEFNAYSPSELKEAQKHFAKFGRDIYEYMRRNYPDIPADDSVQMVDKYRHYAGSLMLRQQSNAVWATILGVGAEVYALFVPGKHASFADVEADFAGIMGFTPEQALSYGLVNDKVFYEIEDQQSPTPTSESYDVVKPTVQFLDEDPEQPQEEKDLIDNLINSAMTTDNVNDEPTDESQTELVRIIGSYLYEVSGQPHLRWQFEIDGGNGNYVQSHSVDLDRALDYSSGDTTYFDNTVYGYPGDTATLTYNYDTFGNITSYDITVTWAGFVETGIPYTYDNGETVIIDITYTGGTRSGTVLADGSGTAIANVAPPTFTYDVRV